MVLNVFTDGASRGNPGKAGIGVAIYRDKELISEIHEYVGMRTNNEAEYLALIKALQKIKELSESSANIFSDSEFLVKQMKKEYKVKAEKIVPLNQMAVNLLVGLDVKFHWVPREDNLKADELANKGIDDNSYKAKHSRDTETRDTGMQRYKDTESEESTVLGQNKIARMANLISKDMKEQKEEIKRQRDEEIKGQRGKNSQSINLLNSLSLKVDKAFFGKINCLKIQMNSENEIYFHIGLLNPKTQGWSWNKVKMSDSELGEIISVLRKDEAKCSFFHSFSEKKTQIWCNKTKESFSIKIGEVSKNLTAGEFEVLRIILEKCIKSRNFN